MPPWGTPCPALPLFLPRRSLLFAPQPTPVIPSKGAETYKDLPRSRLGAGCFHVGVTFYRDIDTTSEFIFSLRDPEETSPRSRDPAILRPRQRVRRPPPPQGLSLPPFSTPPRVVPVGGGTESPRVKRAACGILGGGARGPNLQTAPGEQRALSRALSGLGS